MDAWMIDYTDWQWTLAEVDVIDISACPGSNTITSRLTTQSGRRLSQNTKLIELIKSLLRGWLSYSLMAVFKERRDGGVREIWTGRLKWAIDVKNIDCQIKKNIKNVFFTFIKNIKKH